MLAEVKNQDQECALLSLEALIVEGRYVPGDRLPPERELMAKLGLTRTRLRGALDELERSGRIWRHVGKGTFLTAGTSDRVKETIRQITPMQMMRARLSLEPSLAREAALNASAETMARISLCLSRAANAETWDEYEAGDDVFHRSIAEASSNVLLLALFDQLNQVRRAVAWASVKRRSTYPPPDHASFAEHNRIATAIENRDPASAQTAMREHLTSVSARLFKED